MMLTSMTYSTTTITKTGTTHNERSIRMEWVVTDTEPLVFATAKERKQIQRHRYTQPFIAWDSEGTNEPEPGKPQNLSLFGASTGERIIKRQIRTVEALELICAVGAKNPHANNIAFP